MEKTKIKMLAIIAYLVLNLGLFEEFIRYAFGVIGAIYGGALSPIQYCFYLLAGIIVLCMPISGILDLGDFPSEDDASKSAVLGLLVEFLDFFVGEIIIFLILMGMLVLFTGTWGQFPSLLIAPVFIGIGMITVIYKVLINGCNPQ